MWRRFRQVANLAAVILIVTALRTTAGEEQGCFQGKEPQIRIEACSKILESNPNDATVYHNRGAAYVLAGDTERAIVDFSRAIQIAPHNASAYENRSRAYASRGDLTNATADATKANELIAKAKAASSAPKPPQKAKRQSVGAKPTVKPANEAPPSNGWSWLWGNGGKK